MFANYVVHRWDSDRPAYVSPTSSQQSFVWAKENAERTSARVGSEYVVDYVEGNDVTRVGSAVNGQWNWNHDPFPIERD
jgi:hypothetical protein